MNEPIPDMSTDSAWEAWGRRDPYFGVITHPKFRRSQMSPDSLREFFDSGRQHVDYVMQIIHRDIDPNFAPVTLLDFGCGVGRTLVPFAALAQRAVGLDVSPSMLQEAARNCDEHKLTNVQLFPSDDSLSSLTGSYDLIHSFIVFQHIQPKRGCAIFSRLLRHLGPNGVGAVHFTYAKNWFAETNGLPPCVTAPPSVTAPSSPAASPDIDPEMQMNPYNTNELLFLLQRAGIRRVRVEYTDHGGELGVFLFFQKNPESTGPTAE
jgi:SAM-dependent methyltransferase